MKARWPLIGAIIFFALGFIVPFVAYQNDINQGANDLGDVFWMLVAPSVYAYYAYILWGIAAILLIVAIIVYVKGKKKRRGR